MESLATVPTFAHKDQPVTLTMILDFESTQRSIVIYPCRNFELLNFVCIVPDSSLKQSATESWTAEGDKEELLSLFSDFPSWTTDLLQLVRYNINSG